MDVFTAVLQTIKKTRPILWLSKNNSDCTNEYPKLLSAQDIKDDMLFFLTHFAQDVITVLNLEKGNHEKTVKMLYNLIEKAGLENVTPATKNN
ncbi:MAG: hypothetical protein FWH03_02940 [Firmicutes bacterium]|nr:hypothetical protein [Bacillota bacterium]